MIYFDNAATSYPKPCSVIREVNLCLEKFIGNPGRSGHIPALLAAEKIYDARERLGKHLNFSAPENIVFTLNATYAINMALRAKIPAGSHVITSDIEHNAVIRPLELLHSQLGIEYSAFSSCDDIRANIISEIRTNTSAIVSTLASNVTGRRIPLEILSAVAKEYSLILIVDASQAVGHEKIDLEKNPCDCLCAPAHKGLFGIQGAGFAVFSSANNISPFVVGGSGTNSKSLYMPDFLPEMLEAGTPPTPAIAALCAGTKYVDLLGVEEIEEKEVLLSERIKTGLSLINGVTLYESYGGIVLFNLDGISEWRVVSELDRYGVCVRGGLHCAPAAHRLTQTESFGAVRVSFSCFNTIREVDKFLKILENIRAEI